MKGLQSVLISLALISAFSVGGQLLEIQGDLTTNDVAPRTYKFQAAAGILKVQFAVDAQPGSVAFEIRSPSGKALGRQSAKIATISEWSVTATTAGEYEVVMTPQHTAGHWRMRIDQGGGSGSLAPLYGQCVSAGLMMLVALAAVFMWWRQSRVGWRWFWAGAGVWTVGVALKFGLAIPLNPLFFRNGATLGGMRLVTGSIYCGLLTGIFEIGATLAAALIWRRLAAEPGRAVAVGIGAGAFEAFLLGCGALAGSLVALTTSQTSEALKAIEAAAAHTPVLWLAGPVERAISILAHTGSRVLVLWAVAGRRWTGFWAGFAWLSAVDLLAGFALLSGMTRSGSIWWVELMILPFGILSIPLTRFAIRRWPRGRAETEAQVSQPVSMVS